MPFHVHMSFPTQMITCSLVSGHNRFHQKTDNLVESRRTSYRLNKQSHPQCTLHRPSISPRHPTECSGCFLSCKVCSHYVAQTGLQRGLPCLCLWNAGISCLKFPFSLHWSNSALSSFQFPLLPRQLSRGEKDTRT